MRGALTAALLSGSAGLDLDFKRGQFRRARVAYGSLTAVPGVTFGRSGAAYGRTRAGAFTAFADATPRITDRGLWIEAAATNGFKRSQDIGNAAAWNQHDATQGADATTAPDGTTTADKLIEAATTAIHYLDQPESAAGAARCISVYAKAAGRSWIAIQCASQFAYFNLSGAGAIGAGGTPSKASIVALAGGWYLCSFYQAAPASDARTLYLASADGTLSYAGDGTKGVYLWGAQAELGLVPTSPILTVAAAATRAADALTVTVPAGARKYTVVHDGGVAVGQATPGATLDFGGASGGAWVGGAIQRIIVD